MINKDGGGTILRFYGGHSCYEGGHRAHLGSQSPHTKENPVRGCSVHRGDIMIHVGDHECIRGFSVHQGDAMSILGGYHEYIGGCSVHQSFQ